MIDTFSFAIGFIISLVVETVFIVLFLFWVCCRSYELGWNDCENDEWIGNDFLDFQTPPF